MTESAGYTDMDDRLLTVTDVALRLGTSERTVWRMRQLNQIPQPVKVGTYLIRWRESDIAALIQSLQPAKSPPKQPKPLPNDDTTPKSAQ